MEITRILRRNGAWVAMTVLMLVVTACKPPSTESLAPSGQDSTHLLRTPAEPHSGLPHLATSPDGEVVLSWVLVAGADATLRFSTLTADGNWTPAVNVVTGNNWFVNWADFPSVMPLSGNLWAAHWLVKNADATYAYDVVVAMSEDRGASWSAPVTMHDDGTATEHGFVSLYAAGDDVGAVWLDGRNMIGNGHGHSGDGSATGGMALRSATLTRAHRVVSERVIDELVCDCCQTDSAVTDDGMLVVYRDRTADEIRDIYVARLIQSQWQSGNRVSDDGWRIAGCPVNGPAIDAVGNTVAVAWFTAASDRPSTKFAWSRDGGASFESAVDVDTEGSMGRVDVTVLDDGDAVVSWLRSGSDGRGEICFRRVSADGSLGLEQVLATTSLTRLSGFPQMIRGRDSLIFAWTDVSGDASIVRTARIDTAGLP